MSDELKPCPFCGIECELEEVQFAFSTDKFVTHPIHYCILSGMKFTFNRWQRRFYEDALNQRIAELIQVAGIDNQRLIDAAKRAGVTYFGCDTPEVMADRILYLEGLLRWRPASELPTEDGNYELKFADYNNKPDYDYGYYYSKDGYGWGCEDVIGWRPIPELEVKDAIQNS